MGGGACPSIVSQLWKGPDPSYVHHCLEQAWPARQVQEVDGYRGGHLEAGTGRQLGGMLSGEGRQYMGAKPSLALLPGLALATVICGVNMFGDAVRNLLDPRLRGG